jgi:hypothetical protein
LNPCVRKIRAVAPLTPAQERTRERVETLIGLMAPALTVVLAAGDRISRIVAPEDPEYYPARPMANGEEQGRDSASGISG